MAEIKERHPTWFKMKIERRQLIRQLPTDTAVNVLLACWDYLETGETPETLLPMEKIAFSAFFPDMEEAWESYEKRIKNGSLGGRRANNRMGPYGTEEDTEEETEEETECIQG